MKVTGLSKRGEYYYYRPPQLDGLRPARIALGTTDELEAIRLAAEIKRSRFGAYEPLKLTGEIERYLDAKIRSGEYQKSSAETVGGNLRQFRAWAGEIKVTAISAAMIERWREEAMSEAAENTVTNRLNALKRLLSWLKKRGAIIQNPFDAIKIPVPQATDVPFCTKAQRNLLIDRCDRDDLRFVLMCGFYLGLRKGEIAEAVPAWFEDDQTVSVTKTATFQPKFRKSRRIPFGQTFRTFIADYGLRAPYMLRPEATHGKHRYRYDIRVPFEAHVKACDLPWVSVHTLRHTFATLHIKAGTPITSVSQWLGHRNIQTTYNNYVGHLPSGSLAENLD